MHNSEKIQQEAQRLIDYSQELVLKNNLLGAITFLEKIPAEAGDKFKSAQSLIIQHKIALLKRRFDELKEQAPENLTLDEENLKRWIYHETKEHFEKADGEGQRVLRAWFPDKRKVDEHFEEDGDDELVPVRNTRELTYLKPNSWRPYRWLLWGLSAPATLIPPAIKATSQSYLNMQTISDNVNTFLNIANNDMKHGCFFEPSIQKMPSPLKYPLDKLNIVSSTLLGIPVLSALVLAFFLAIKYGETGKQRYLITALALASTALCITIGTDKITNSIYSRLSKDQTYNLVWSVCSAYNSTEGSTQPKGICAKSPNCIYPPIDIADPNNAWDNQDLDFLFGTPSAPNFLNSFFMSGANILLCLGVAGVIILLGTFIGFSKSLTEVVEYRDDLNPVPYGTNDRSNRRAIELQPI